MPTFRLSYPVTAEVTTALARFPEIGRTVTIPPAGRSDLEIVRMLGNTHYAHLDRLLAFIEHELPGADEIGARAVKQRDPFQFREALAELFLFAHLRSRLGVEVRPAVFPKNARGPEIEVARQDLVARIEVYSPIDLMGYQLVTEHLPMLFKYLEVNRGFTVEVSVEPVDNSTKRLFYPQTLPDEHDVLAWLAAIGERALRLLGRPVVGPGEHMSLPGPGGTTKVRVRVRDVNRDPEVRQVVFTSGTRGTDARLLFEIGTAPQIARSAWGEKLKKKMRRRQAGPPTAGVLRVLIVNFAQAETGWPDFFMWPQIATRLEQTVRLLANELTSGLPYDLVLPANLGITSEFGVPIWLDASFHGPATAFMRSAGIDRKSRPRSTRAPVLDPDEIEELVEGAMPREEVRSVKPTNQAAIETFGEYFAEQLRLIGEVPNHHYRKTLFVGVLDTLSRAGVPQLKDKNRERFIRFTEAFAEWAEAGRVSLPQLAGNLGEHADLAHGAMATEVERRLREWKDGQIYHASDDPVKDEIVAFAANDVERRLVEAHTHLNLLWVYRNMLVHEFREPGYDMGVLGDDPSPYYMSMEDERGASRWELAYPTTFFAALAERALAKLKGHLEANDLDPYSFYEFGSIWKRMVLKG